MKRFLLLLMVTGCELLEADGYDEDDDFDGECGNGVIEYIEGCDDGDRDTQDGCNHVCQVELRADVDWRIESITAQTMSSCPVGFDTAVVTLLPPECEDLACSMFGVERTTACSTGKAPIAVGDRNHTRLKVTVRFENEATNEVYAESLEDNIDLSVSTKSSHVIYDDGGFVTLAVQMLRDNEPSNCFGVATNMIRIEATPMGGGTPIVSDLPCEGPEAVTNALVSPGLLAGRYSITISSKTATTTIDDVLVTRRASTDLGLVSLRF